MKLQPTKSVDNLTEGSEVKAIAVRTLTYVICGALLLILFSMIQRRLMGVAISLTPRAFVVPVIFGGGSGLLLAIWQERLRKTMMLLSISEDRYRTVTDFATDLTYLLSPDGTLHYVSPAAFKLTGYSPSDFISDPSLLDKIIHSDDKQIWLAHKSHHSEQGEFEEVHVRIVTKNGRVRWIRHVCRPISNESGEFLGIRGSNSDITEIKNAENEIRELNLSLESKIAERTARLETTLVELNCLNEDLLRQRQALECSNQDLEAFSYSVSHDLRAPLRHIIGFCSILSQECCEKLSTEEMFIVDRISNATNRMDKMIDSMLHLAKIRNATMCKVPVNLSEIAESVASMLRDTSPGRSIKVTIEENLTTIGDKMLLENAIQNLFANAWKYTSMTENAEIEFGREIIDGVEQFYIRDNGVGFDMAYADKLFTAFQRLHGREFEGSGIGLATVKRIIDLHGGNISGEGQKNCGAVFRFTLGSSFI
ncbi:PAS domain S-box protein [Geobacter pelophilus]|uniref:histidine kinase n=1 Tax=Geoanaerobacter pelophilus TaxID=60036 RepID=A0AAW4L5D9_9BACT|nr:PAS domain-containing sensor histidine kinase [Geoanaerobacter pelophilus]MBT0666439.1 PAS domain S-box protein [Geoanaerobacter pelophilus]